MQAKKVLHVLHYTITFNPISPPFPHDQPFGHLGKGDKIHSQAFVASNYDL